MYILQFLLLFHKTIRHFLLFILLTLIISPFIITFFSRISKEKYLASKIASFGEIPIHLSFDDISYHSFDKEGSPIKINAPKAVSKNLKMEEITLFKPDIYLYPSKQRKVHIQSNITKINRLEDKISLEGNVIIEDKQGDIKARSENLLINTKNSQISFPQKTTIHTKDGFLKSGKIDIDSHNKKAVFSDGVKILITPPP